MQLWTSACYKQCDCVVGFLRDPRGSDNTHAAVWVDLWMLLQCPPSAQDCAHLADGGDDGVHHLALEGPEGDGCVLHAELREAGAFPDDALPNLLHQRHADYVPELPAASALHLRTASTWVRPAPSYAHGRLPQDSICMLHCQRQRPLATTTASATAKTHLLFEFPLQDVSKLRPEEFGVQLNLFRHVDGEEHGSAGWLLPAPRLSEQPSCSESSSPRRVRELHARLSLARRWLGPSGQRAPQAGVVKRGRDPQQAVYLLQCKVAHESTRPVAATPAQL